MSVNYRMSVHLHDSVPDMEVRYLKDSQVYNVKIGSIDWFVEPNRVADFAEQLGQLARDLCVAMTDD